MYNVTCRNEELSCKISHSSAHRYEHRTIDFGNNVNFVKAKFHYANWSQISPRLVADVSQTCLLVT